jgi:crossover junction endodeoxyribonuclease RusA
VIALTLPYPPSVNDYYGCSRAGGRYIKPKGRAFRIAVAETLCQHDRAAFAPFQVGELAARVLVNAPTGRRAQDADNGHKALLDALTHSGVWTDDRQVRLLLTEYGEPIAGGSVSVFVEKLEKVSVSFEFLND